ncbi:MAG: hypothetical protein LBK59_06060 [Bifidobacteriaceae bacterium]|jgi:hypothetical protein|nr:hypothetical protein [Bifidobacteriaceae bacterium]
MAIIPVGERNQPTARVPGNIRTSKQTAQVTKNGIVRWHIMPVPARSASRVDTLVRAGLATRLPHTPPHPHLNVILATRPKDRGRAVPEALGLPPWRYPVFSRWSWPGAKANA